MTKHSTLLYCIDDFNKTSQETYNPVFCIDDFDPGFLYAFFRNLEFDPGDDLVKKILLKASL